MNKYYYLKGDAQQGPLVVDELKTQITRETLVWREGMSDWLAAKDVPEIAGVLPPPVPGVNTSTPPPPPPNPTKPQPQLRSISYDQEKKSSKKWWFIVGGSVVGLMLFFLYNSIQSTPTEITPEPNIETPVVDNYIEVDEVNPISPSIDPGFVPVPGWEEQVEISAEYSKVGIGGIRDVVVTVNNKWCCKIEELIVSVHYIKENGEEFESERITLNDIDKGESKIQTAIGSRRGSSINLAIYEIHSKGGYVNYRTFN